MDIRPFQQVSEYIWDISPAYKKGMRTAGRIYATRTLLESMDNAVLDQLANVCMLPGIVGNALCMPDGHSGYGFPIGGVAAMDLDEGVISPGGIGFDINCGVRLMITDLTIDDIGDHMKDIIATLFRIVPSGIGPGGTVNVRQSTLDDIMVQGAHWAIANGYGEKSDLEYTEETGRIGNADPSCISNRARERGKNQLGSLGSGNHYLEIQVIPEKCVYDADRAACFGIHRENQIAVMIHSGSRGFGHQVATDYLGRFLSVMGPSYGLSMPDRELACAPFSSSDGQSYYGAMNCAINIAFLNRQLLMHAAREAFCNVMKRSPDEMGMRLVYDVCHNTAKIEEHEIRGKIKRLLVHRKGATRAFGPGMHGIPASYAACGQPVLIGGSMESGSYLLCGEKSSSRSYYSTAHGSGRLLSRHQARRMYNGRELQKKLEAMGITIMTSSYSGLAEEAGGAYKNVDEIADVTEKAGLSTRVAKLIPIANIKG